MFVIFFHEIHEIDFRHVDPFEPFVFSMGIFGLGSVLMFFLVDNSSDTVLLDEPIRISWNLDVFCLGVFFFRILLWQLTIFHPHLGEYFVGSLGIQAVFRSTSRFAWMDLRHFFPHISMVVSVSHKRW